MELEPEMKPKKVSEKRLKEVVKKVLTTQGVNELLEAYKKGNNCHLVRYPCRAESYPIATKRLDLSNGCISLGYPDGKGGFFTHIPISSKEYRKYHPTKASWEIMVEEDNILLVAINSDHGNEYFVLILNEEVKNPAVVESIEKIKNMEK